MRYFGAAYYPELFPCHEWEADMARMAEAGMNLLLSPSPAASCSTVAGEYGMLAAYPRPLFTRPYTRRRPPAEQED